MKHVEKQFAGRTLKIEAGRLAKQAAGSCLLQFGETVVLAAVTVSENIANLPYFPLTVEYREKSYAAGKIPGGFLKREGRPSDEEITSARVIDTDGLAIPGLYAAGEMVGGIFYFNYPGGTGLTNGSVFGRIAGTTAGTRARGRNA